jgi:hypothetical protein
MFQRIRGSAGVPTRLPPRAPPPCSCLPCSPPARYSHSPLPSPATHAPSIRLTRRCGGYSGQTPRRRQSPSATGWMKGWVTWWSLSGTAPAQRCPRFGPLLCAGRRSGSSWRSTRCPAWDPLAGHPLRPSRSWRSCWSCPRLSLPGTQLCHHSSTLVDVVVFLLHSNIKSHSNVKI